MRSFALGAPPTHSDAPALNAHAVGDVVPLHERPFATICPKSSDDPSSGTSTPHIDHSP